MDPPSWSTLNHFSHLSAANKASTSENHSNHHRAMANFPALSPPFSRQDASLASFHQGAAHLLLHPSGSHGASADSFINPATSGLLTAGYSAAGLLPYATSGSQPNLAHSNLFNSFQQKESELNELREGFSRGLHPLSMLATSQSQNAVSRAASDLFASGLPQNPATSATWHLPSPIPSSSMFGVLPHESVGSKTGEKTRSSSKSQGKSHSNSSNHATTASKASSFVYGTSPSAGTTAKTVISNDLLSSPTYLPQPQYNSFLNLNEKKEVYDQSNSALDYTSAGGSAESSQKQNLETEAYNSDCQRNAKCDSELSHQSPMPHQSPMMASHSPATSHNSPMVSSAVISPVEPPAYSPASNLRYGENSYDMSTVDNNAQKYSSGSTSHCSSSQLPLDHIKPHSSPHGSSLCNQNSPMSSSTVGTGSPFVSESPRESLTSKDFPCVNSNLSSRYNEQQSMLSSTNCNLTAKENYDLVSQRHVATRQHLVPGMDNMFPSSENLDDLSLQELAGITDGNSRLPCVVDQTPGVGLKSSSENTASSNGNLSTRSSSSARKKHEAGDAQPRKELLPSEKQYIFRNRQSDGTETKSKIFSRSGKQSGKPAGFFNSYLSFIKKSPPKGQRKRGRPRKYPVLPANMGTRVPSKSVKEPKAVDGHLTGNFTFSDSEEEQETNHNISDTVQLALKTLTDNEMDKSNDKLSEAATSNAKQQQQPRHKIYENSADANSNSETSMMDVYDFDSEFCEPEVQPSSFRFSSQKKKPTPARKTSVTDDSSQAPPPPPAPVTPSVPNDNAVRRLSMRKCAEKLIQKREQRTAKRKLFGKSHFRNFRFAARFYFSSLTISLAIRAGIAYSGPRSLK